MKNREICMLYGILTLMISSLRTSSLCSFSVEVRTNVNKSLHEGTCIISGFKKTARTYTHALILICGPNNAGVMF